MCSFLPVLPEMKAISSSGGGDEDGDGHKDEDGDGTCTVACTKGKKEGARN